jgi:hypothetical protein
MISLLSSPTFLFLATPLLAAQPLCTASRFSPSIAADASTGRGSAVAPGLILMSLIF